MKKIAILTAGGDAPGMNTCIYHLYKELNNDFELYGVLDGFKGIIEKRFVSLNESNVSSIENKGGTFLGSVRFPSFSDHDIQEKAYQILKENNFEYVIAIGGDGTSLGAKALNSFGINTLWIPATIDNDSKYSNPCIGFYTCCANAVSDVLKIKDTMESHHRFVVIETMGRYCGDICKKVSIDSGADISIPYGSGRVVDSYLDDIKKVTLLKQSGVIIISEHQTDVYEFAKKIEDYCHVESRGVVLGYIQRGGSPVKEDKNICKKFARFAKNKINSNKSGYIGFINGKLKLSKF